MREPATFRGECELSARGENVILFFVRLIDGTGRLEFIPSGFKPNEHFAKDRIAERVKSRTA